MEQKRLLQDIVLIDRKILDIYTQIKMKEFHKESFESEISALEELLPLEK